MASSSTTHFCTLCQEDDVSTQAVSWCLECEDWLCTDCDLHHGRSKASKQHKAITVDAFEALPPSVLNISNRCTKHHDRFERFCSFHAAACCIQCVSEAHKECELSPLVEVLHNIRESSTVSHLERDLNEIMENFEGIERHLLEILTNVQDEKNHCVNEIKRIRMSVNDHLDKIERNVLVELSQKEKTIKKKIESLASEIESKKRRGVNLQYSLLGIKQYATDLQVFLSIKEMEKQTIEYSKYLEDVEVADSMNHQKLEVEVSKTLESLQRSVVAFGKITVTSVPSTFKLSKTNQGQGQLILRVVSALDKVNLVKELTIRLTGRKPPLFSACAILPTGECVIADYGNNVLVLHDKNGAYVRGIVSTFGMPSDMCYIEDDIVAMAAPTTRNVELIKVSRNLIKKTINVKSSCNGIDYNHGKLFIRLPKEDVVFVMDIDGKIEQRVNIRGKDITRIACFKNYIYCTNSQTNEVLCYDMTGKLVWNHKNEALINPVSITIDKRLGIIYVAGSYSNNLAAISLDGDKSKIVLSPNDGLKEVCAVNVSKENKLLICNRINGIAFLYQL